MIRPDEPAGLLAIRNAAEAFGTEACMYGVGVGRRCPNPPTHRSSLSTCVWCEEHADANDLPITHVSEDR